MSTSVACKTKQEQQQNDICIGLGKKKANRIDKKLIWSHFYSKPFLFSKYRWAENFKERPLLNSSSWRNKIFAMQTKGVS